MHLLDVIANDRRPKLESTTVAADADKSSVVPRSDDESGEDVKENGGTNAAAVKKVKEKKIKEPKITMAVAAAKINVSDLDAHLLDVVNLSRAGGTDLDVEACVGDEAICVRFCEFVVGERSDVMWLHLSARE